MIRGLVVGFHGEVGEVGGVLPVRTGGDPRKTRGRAPGLSELSGDVSAIEMSGLSLLKLSAKCRAI